LKYDERQERAIEKDEGVVVLIEKKGRRRER
jgi:predicted metalloprotease